MQSTVCYEIYDEVVKEHLKKRSEVSEEIDKSKFIALENNTSSTAREAIEVSSFSAPFIEVHIDFEGRKFKTRLTKETIQGKKRWKKESNQIFVRLIDVKECNNAEYVKQKILDFIDKNPGSLTSEIIEELNFDTWSILEALDELKEEGCLE